MNNALILTAQQYQDVKNTPSKIITLAPTRTGLKANERIKLGLTGAADIAATDYMLRIEMTHDNANALTVDTFKFWRNIIKEIALQLGTGNDVFELGIREMLYRQLKTRQRVASTIDKTSGAGKVSTLTLIIDLLSIGYISPKDTLLYVANYDQKNLYIHAGEFDTVTDCTVSDVQMKLTENFLQNTTPITRQKADGTKTIVNAIKRPVLDIKAMNGATTSFEIPFPENEQTSEVYLYVIDGNGDLVDGKIKDITIKNPHTQFRQYVFSEVQEQNQIDLFSVSNSLFNGVAWINIAGGKYSRSVNTSNAKERGTKLILNVDPNGAADLTVHALFETVRG